MRRPMAACGPAAVACRPTDSSPASPPTASTGLLQMGARFYSPFSGRFISADTIVPGAGNPQNLNRYSYVYNRPLNHIDSDGHLPIPIITGLIGGAIGGAIGTGAYALNAYSTGQTINGGDMAVAAAGGALGGGRVVIDTAAGTIQSTLSDKLHGKDVNWSQAIKTGAVSGISSAVGEFWNKILPVAPSRWDSLVKPTLIGQPRVSPNLRKIVAPAVSTSLYKQSAIAMVRNTVAGQLVQQ